MIGLFILVKEIKFQHYGNRGSAQKKVLQICYLSINGKNH